MAQPYTYGGGDSLRFSHPVTGNMLNLRVSGTLTGVAILKAATRNGPGVGTLRSTGDGTLLSWKAPGSSTYGPGIDCSVDGTYRLEDGEDQDKWLRVQVSASHLGIAATASIYLTDYWNNEIADADVTAGEASAGDVHEWTVYMNNDSPITLSDIVVWIDAAVSGIKISDNGVAWVNPTSEATGLSFPDLVAGGQDTLHLQRTIAASSSSDPDVLNHIHAAYGGL